MSNITCYDSLDDMSVCIYVQPILHDLSCKFVLTIMAVNEVRAIDEMANTHTNTILLQLDDLDKMVEHKVLQCVVHRYSAQWPHTVGPFNFIDRCFRLLTIKHHILLSS